MNDTHEDVAVAIMEYIDEYYSMPAPKWPEDSFRQYTYSKWAANELLAYVSDFPFDPPIDVIENFIIRLTYYSCAAKDVETRLIFSIATDTVDDILTFVSHNC